MKTQRRIFVKTPALFFSLALLFAVLVMPLAFAGAAMAQEIEPSNSTCSSTDTSCNVCMNSSQFSSPNTGSAMIGQIFSIINGILQKIESAFYNGIINNTGFQTAVGSAFVLYLAVFGVMITFNLASYRSGEVAGRLVKIAIVYAMTTSGGWSLFSNLVQAPIVGGINQLIGNMANTGSGSGGNCVTQGSFSGSSVTTSGTDAASVSVSLDSGAMAMLYGPMTCVFAAKFIAGVEATLMAGPYSWPLAIVLAFGLKEFVLMLLGAIATYVKAIVGLTFLFGLAPIFFAFYLFDRSRYITLGWINMVVGFALQPVMVFAFLAFYATIIGTALSNIFVDQSGNQENLCYVPWLKLPGLFTIYWWRFTNASSAAGGEWLSTSGSGVGGIQAPPVNILNALYFLVLCSLGKSFTSFVAELSIKIAGGGGAGIVTGDDVGSWFKNNLTGGKGPTALATSGLKGLTNGVETAWNRVIGGSSKIPTRLPSVPRRPLPGGGQ